MARNRTTPEPQVLTVNYDSVSSFVSDMSSDRRPPNGVYQSHDDRGRRDFFWSDSFAEARTIQQQGWREGAEKVARHREGFSAFIAAAAKAKAVTPHWDYCGIWYDAAKDLAGDPECWCDEQFAGDAVASRVVSLRLNNCVSAAVDTSTIVARGLAVLVAVDLLEACGTRCEVIVGTATRTGLPMGGDRIVESNVVVKKAGDHAEPNALAFNVAHPSFFRRFGFRFMELGGHSPSGCLPCPMSDCGKRPGVVEIDELLSGVRLDDAAVRKNVLAIAAKCGLEFNPRQMEELLAASR